MPIVQIDTNTGKIIKSFCNGKWYALKGKCIRCGKCCETNGKSCLNLEHETVDNKVIAKCKIQWSKTWSCVCYPDKPDKPMIEGCGFYWEEIIG